MEDLEHLASLVGLLQSQREDLRMVSDSGATVYSWRLLISFFSKMMSGLLNNISQEGELASVTIPVGHLQLQQLHQALLRNDLKSLEGNEAAILLGISKTHIKTKVNLDQDVSRRVSEMIDTFVDGNDIKLEEDGLNDNLDFPDGFEDDFFVDSDEGIYDCNQCDFKTKVTKSFRIHLKRQHGSNLKYDCEECVYTTVSETRLTTHKANKHGYFVCDECTYTTNKKSDFTKHKSAHHSSNINCDYDSCEFEAKSFTTVERHKEVVHLKMKYICEMCSKELPSRNMLKRHIKITHEGLKYICDQCDFKTTAMCNLRNHRSVVHEGQKFQCESCEYAGSSMHRLTEHIRAKHGGESLKCDQCQFECAYASTLNNHKKVKHEGHKYNCDQCDYQVSDRVGVMRHKQKVHDGVRFSCGQCDYKATEKGNLKKHIKNKHLM